MSFLRKKFFVLSVLFFCFFLPYAANAFLPAAVSLALRFTPAAAKALRPFIKAITPAKKIGPNKVQLSLFDRGARQDRVLQVSLAATSTAAAALVLWLGYKATMGGSWRLLGVGGIGEVGSGYADYNAATAAGVDYCLSNGGSSTIVGSGDITCNLPAFSSVVQDTGVPIVKSAVDVMLTDIELNPSQASTDNLVDGLKAMPDADWDAIVEMMDTAEIQPTSDYFSGDTIAVNTLGEIVLNGVVQDAATYVGKDGKAHVLKLDKDGNVLVDGQPATGPTASNPSNPSAPVTQTGSSDSTVVTDPVSGVKTTVTSTTSTDSAGNTVTTTTTTVYDPATGKTTSTTDSTSVAGAPVDVAAAVDGNGIGASFDNFGLGVGQQIGDQFAPLTQGGAETCFTTKFAGTHCLSDFDPAGIWTNYVRAFFGFLGSVLAFAIPLFVALRL